MGPCSRLGESPNTWKHFGPELTQVLNSVISVLLCQETATWGGCDLGDSGVWKGDYGWGDRVRRPFGARGRSSVRYGIRLGDLKNKQPTHTHVFAMFCDQETYGTDKFTAYSKGKLFNKQLFRRVNFPIQFRRMSM